MSQDLHRDRHIATEPDRNAAIDHLQQLLDTVRQGRVKQFNCQVDYESRVEPSDGRWERRVPTGTRQYTVTVTVTPYATGGPGSTGVPLRGESGCELRTPDRHTPAAEPDAADETLREQEWVHERVRRAIAAHHPETHTGERWTIDAADAALSVAADDLPGMVEMLRRRAEAAEAERDNARSVIAQLREERDAVQRSRDEALAELQHWRSGRRRKGMPTVESVPDAVHHAAAMARASHDDELPEHIGDLMRGAAQRIRTLHDTASWLLAERDQIRAERDEYRQAAEAEAQLEDESQTSVRRLREERDALQARIDGVLSWGDDQTDGLRSEELVTRGWMVGWMREYLVPADDGSEAESGEPKSPFQPGDWVRGKLSGYCLQVRRIQQAWDGRWTVRHNGALSDFDFADNLEPWQPRKGERVRVGDSGPSSEVLLVSHDGFVTLTGGVEAQLSSLRPAEEGDDDA